MEEWHYTQHLQDHAQEEEQMAQLHAAQIPTRVPSPPRKLRCLECGKRFLRPEQFARHTKWHLKLIIILDGDEAEAVPVAAERHYAELQASVFDGQAATNAVQPVFLRTEEQAAVLEPPVSTNLLQAGEANKQQQPPPAATTSPRSPVVMRLLPCPTGDHPEVLDLEYDTGGGIPVASEPWDVNLHAGQETPSPSPAAEDGFIVVEMESELGQQGLVVGEHHDHPQQRTFRRARKPPLRHGSIWRFKCPDCGVCYSQHSQLRSHQKGRKRRGRSFLCECGSPFRGLLHLLRHQLRHLEEALFICSTCGKSLQGHAGLQRHNSCHPGLARFSCPCGIHFRRLSRYLWHHVRSQRPGLRVYTLAGFLSST
ncbi:Myeloid zinc finger 1, partial [Ophiophagus hannah]